MTAILAIPYPPDLRKAEFRNPAPDRDDEAVQSSSAFSVSWSFWTYLNAFGEHPNQADSWISPGLFSSFLACPNDQFMIPRI